MKKTVLLAVDDRPDNLHVLQSLIAEHLPDCELVTAGDAREGLAVAADTDLDGALIDVQMPGMDGIEMCRRLKSHEATQHIPVILLTAHHAGEALKAEGLTAGADDFLGKPISNLELVAKVRAMLRIKATEDELREANERLAELVAERTQDLDEAHEADHRFIVRLATLSEVTWELSRAESMADMCRAAVELGRQRLGFDRLGLWLVDERDPMFVHGTWGTDENGRIRNESQTRLRTDTSPVAKLMVMSRERLSVHEDTDLLDDQGGAVGRGTNAVAPLWDGEETIGYLAADNLLRREPITAHDTELLRFYASAVGHLCTGKRAEDALVRSEHIVSSSSDMLALLSADFVHLAANDMYARAFGRSRDELIGHRAVEVFGEEFFERTIRPNAERCMAGDDVRHEEWFDFAATGRRYMDVAYSRHSCPGEETGGFVVSARDITEHKALEEQLLHSQKLEAIGQLAGGVAHDFNNIMTGIGGFVGFALDEIDEASQAHRDLMEVQQLAERATALTRQLLAFSRKQPLEAVAMDVNSLVEESAAMLQRLIGEHVEFRFNPGSDLPTVVADPYHVSQVLMNLAINARDAMPMGGKLTIETASVTLNQGGADAHPDATPGQYVVLSVTDTGEGMDEDTQRRAFEPFFTTKEVGRGTGLGLSTVYGIVRQHGGHVSVRSTPGKGATFDVYLPYAGDAPEVEPRLDGASTPSASETVLILDDEEAVRTVAGRVLEAEGYHVLSAASGEEAESLLGGRDGQVELLLTDLVLPGTDGRKVYRRLCATCRSLKVIYMSGHTDNSTVHHGALEEGVPFLQKPFECRHLVATVRQVLDG